MNHTNSLDLPKVNISLLPGIVISLVLLLLISSRSSLAADITVTATLDRATMTLAETAELVVTVNGSGTADLHMTEVEGLDITESGHSRQLQLINGTASSSLAVTYLIQPLKPGQYTIPAINVEVDGKKLQTEAIPLRVLSSPQQRPVSSPSPSSQDQQQLNTDGQTAFLRLEMQRGECYVGERLPILIKAYFPQNMQATVNTLPDLKGNGFVMEQLDSRPRQTLETLNGATYNVLSWTTNLTGVKEGIFPLQLQLDATLLVRQRTRSLSPFPNQDPLSEDFFNTFMGGIEKKPLRITSPEATMEILPLPAENKPKDFSGAIGDFTLQVKAVPTSVEIGQPLNVIMTIEGTGNFDRVESPVFPALPGWKSYSPSAHFTSQGGSWKGKKVFEQAIVIKDKAIQQIPPLSFSYFDPSKKQYVTRTSIPIPLDINETSQKSTPPPAPTANTSTQNQKSDFQSAKKIAGNRDLAPLHTENGPFFQKLIPTIYRPWFLIPVVLCGVVLLLLFGIWLKRRWLTRHPEVVRKKHQLRLLTQASADLEQAITAYDSPNFLSCCRSIIQQQIAMCWQVSPEVITLADLTARLGEDSLLVEIFAAAEKGVYAGYGLSPQKMREYADTLLRECRRLL